MINIKEEPYRLYEIDNPTEGQCLTSVKYDSRNIFMVKNLTPKIKECVDPLFINLWYDLRILNFDYGSFIENFNNLFCKTCN